MTAEDRMAQAWRFIFYALAIGVVLVVGLTVKAFAHAVIFVNRQGHVWCFVQSSGS